MLLTGMLEATKFHSTDFLLRCITQSFPMFGDFPETGVFPSRPHVAKIDKEQISKSSKWPISTLMGDRRGSSDPKLDEIVRQLTADEVKAGECRGPFALDDMKKRHPKGFVAARRFPVPQKG